MILIVLITLLVAAVLCLLFLLVGDNWTNGGAM